MSFTSAAYALQVAWVRLFADAGCLDDEGLANATQWVSDYVTAPSDRPRHRRLLHR